MFSFDRIFVKNLIKLSVFHGKDAMAQQGIDYFDKMVMKIVLLFTKRKCLTIVIA